jgi:hypothetical protein
MSKAELLEECERRGLESRKSWTKAQPRDALTPKPPARPKGRSKKAQPKLSRAAQTIVNQMERI